MTDHMKCRECACCIGTVCIQDHSPSGRCTATEHVEAWRRHQQRVATRCVTLVPAPRELPDWVEPIRIKLNKLVAERMGILPAEMANVFGPVLRKLEEDAILLIAAELKEAGQ